MRRHIPNAITCCNLLSGCVAAVYAFQGLYLVAFVCIIMGAVFDFFDGLTARALKVSSPIGKELDSLADVVTFGFAPAAMVFSWLGECVEAHSTTAFDSRLSLVGALLPFLAFLLVAFSALRLAKFNVDERQTSSFIGLPTPANALFWASLVVGYGDFIYGLNYGWLLMIGLVLLSCYLLVADIPMFSLKFKYFAWRANKLRYSFLIASAPMLLLGVGAAVPIISLYVAVSIIKSLRKKRAA